MYVLRHLKAEILCSTSHVVTGGTAKRDSKCEIHFLTSKVDCKELGTEQSLSLVLVEVIFIPAVLKCWFFRFIHFFSIVLTICIAASKSMFGIYGLDNLREP